MSDQNPPAYCWDACIFLEHFRIKEPASDSKRQAIRRLLAENAERKNTIFASSITHLEVLPKKLTRDDSVAEEKYWNLFGSRFFYEIPVDGAIIKLAREIKDFYFKEAEVKTATPCQIMDTGDAIHLATAIINDATEFHTRDNSRKGSKVPLLTLSGLSPNGLVAGRFELKIVSPEEKQLDLLRMGSDQETAI